MEPYTNPSAALIQDTAALCKEYLENDAGDVLEVEKHIRFLELGLHGLPSGFVVLDASRPWIIYWALHSIFLLGSDVSSYSRRVIDTLSSMQNITGGYGGNYSHFSHLAPTYAAVNALAIIGTNEAYESIDRTAMYTWLKQLKQQDGSFMVHVGGEVDTRGAYCAISIASLLNLLDEDLTRDLGTWLSSCQTFDGGISCLPFAESHGGYVFCALAALSILKSPSNSIAVYLDVPALIQWLSARQTKEGGFSGRTNKIVDGCYSWWVGACWSLLQAAVSQKLEWDRESLQKYVLRCCQAKHGGLRDKPGRHADAYHTCYCLSGLSSSNTRFEHTDTGDDQVLAWRAVTLDPSLAVGAMHPLYAIDMAKADGMWRYFR